MDEELVVLDSSTEERKRPSESFEEEDDSQASPQKKTCAEPTKTGSQILLDYRNSISPKPEKYCGFVNISLPTTTNKSDGWLHSDLVSIGGFMWRISACVDDTNLLPQIQCNPTNQSNIWICKATCEMGMLAGGKRVSRSSIMTKSHNFCAKEKGIAFEAKPSWHHIINSSTDGQISLHAMITVVTEAGLRTFTPNNFMIPSTHSDVVLLVDSFRFHVNKATLAMQSPFFDTLFFSGFAEKNKEEVQLNDIHAAEFAEFLELMYPSGHSIHDRNYVFILELADMFQVSRLLKACEDFLCANVDSSPIKMLKLADRYKLPRVATVFADSFKDSAALKAFTKKTGFHTLSPVIKVEILQKFATF